MKCRICKSKDYKSVLNLGSIYPSNFIDVEEGIEPKPLHLVQCNNCNLVQLRDSYDLDKMYKEHYWYRSGLNNSMVKSLQDVVSGIHKRYNTNFSSNEKPIVVDIGCNDGTMLNMFDNKFTKVGFDPAPNLSPNCDAFFNDYFSVDTYLQRFEEHSANIVTAIAMFYDLENPNKFLQDVKRIIKPYGILVIQFTDLLSMLKVNAFDNICHEHLEYYSLEVLNKLLVDNGFKIFDLEYNKVNGGSIRVYAVPFTDYNYPKINVHIYAENDYLKEHPVEEFNWRVVEQKTKLLTFLNQEKRKDKTIYVLGASTKGNTLLQHFGIYTDLVDKALEVNKDKFGKRTIGTNIPIVSEQEGLKENPDYLLVLPWHFSEFFIEKFEDYLNSGGALILPLPKFCIITSTKDSIHYSCR